MEVGKIKIIKKKLLLTIGSEIFIIHNASPVSKHLVVVFGMSDSTAQKLILKFGIPLQAKMSFITWNQFFCLFIYLFGQFIVKKESKNSLDIITAFNKKLAHKQIYQETENVLFYARYQRIRNHHYKGIRHAWGLPVRGQRTKSNAISVRSHIFNARIRRVLRYVKFEELRLRLLTAGSQQVQRRKSIVITASTKKNAKNLQVKNKLKKGADKKAVKKVKK